MRQPAGRSHGAHAAQVCLRDVIDALREHVHARLERRDVQGLERAERGVHVHASDVRLWSVRGLGPGDVCEPVAAVLVAAAAVLARFVPSGGEPVGGGVAVEHVMRASVAVDPGPGR